MTHIDCASHITGANCKHQMERGCVWMGCYKSTVALCHKCCLAPYHHTAPPPVAATVSETTVESQLAHSPATRNDIVQRRHSNFMVKKVRIISKFYGSRNPALKPPGGPFCIFI